MMNITTTQLKTVTQHVMADAAVVFGVLTQTLSGIHLSPTASAILGVFGILLHPWTSVTATPPSPPTP
jgi:hypothetical protein